VLDVALVQGRFPEAVALFEEARAIFELRGGRNEPRLIPLLNNLGLLYFDLRHYDIAGPYVVRAEELSRYVLGPNHPDLAGPLNMVGRILLMEGDIEGARSRFEQARAL
jgi:hypothetical protein